MRLGYLFTTFPKPSETFVYREVLGLLERGIDARIYALRGPSEAEREVLPQSAIELSRKVTYLRPPQLLRGLLDALSGSTAWPLCKTLREDGALPQSQAVILARAHAIARLAREDGITHLHAHWPYACMLAAMVQRITDLTLSISIHAHEVAHENDHFLAIFKDLSFAAFCNRAAMNYLLERLPPRTSDKCHLIYHGVDLSAFTQLAPAPPPPPLRVISAGRFTRTKGFDRLIDAVDLATRTGVDVDLTILGDGSERERLRGLAESRGIADRVHLPGWVTPSEVQRALAKSHVFSLLADASYHDGLPNVVLEALAVGRPVILSPLPAAREALEDGINGYILSAVDAIDELVDRWKQLADAPERAADMARAARLGVEQRFDDDIHLGKMIELFEEV
ncbi:MAG: glycosyltransferase [Myxococcales bacterium]|nr:glycosyltransferase [Myxococcales bacterium]